VNIEEAKIIAVDFDGTLVEVGHPYPKIGKLKKDAKKVINKLYDDGYYIIIWTCRGDVALDEMIKFLNRNKINYDKVNENADYDIIGIKPLPKIFYNYLIDDRCLLDLPDWKTIYKIITGVKYEKD